jgi:hypothetical protein
MKTLGHSNLFLISLTAGLVFFASPATPETTPVQAEMSFAHSGGISFTPPVSGNTLPSLDEILSDIRLLGVPGQLAFLFAECRSENFCGNSALLGTSGRRYTISAASPASDSVWQNSPVPPQAPQETVMQKPLPEAGNRQDYEVDIVVLYL